MSMKNPTHPHPFRLLFAYGRGASSDDQDEAGRPDLLRLQGIAAT